MSDVIYSREEVERAFEATLRLQANEDWESFAQTFTPDAVYEECEFGRMVGREAIVEWLLPAMEPCKGWVYPERWRVVEGNRVSYGWYNRLPGRRPDGTYYEFLGTSCKVYAGNGQFSYHEDVYNMKACITVIKEWSAAHRR